MPICNPFSDFATSKFYLRYIGHSLCFYVATCKGSARKNALILSVLARHRTMFKSVLRAHHVFNHIDWANHRINRNLSAQIPEKVLGLELVVFWHFSPVSANKQAYASVFPYFI